MSFLMSTEELKNQLQHLSNDLVIVDVRFQLNNPHAGKKMYEEGHIPSSVFLDIDEDLSGEKQKHGGNHPLPKIEDFAETLGNIGIDHNTTVVIYDQGNDMFSPRLWWMLHYVGHDKVFVLEGGLERWVADGNQTTKEIPSQVKKEFKPVVRSNEVVHMEQVKEKINNKTAILIDSRAPERYLGITEPLYTKAGHIPGAKNYFWKDVLNQNGQWKSPEELLKHFHELPKNEEIIVSCGSGISATPNIMALKMAGYKNIKLYPGSYSDWISYEENNVINGRGSHFPLANENENK